ncbi:nascent polypeptide-associated complex protein [uncultured archaeon]|nr:nascent polypeptide-associated complex protein [uncultured archaeon]
MIPGRMNNREMKRMMAQMGIKSSEMPDVKTVIFQGETKDYMITDAQVTMVEAQGQKTFQVVGTFKEIPKSAKPGQQAEAPKYSDDDISLVMEGAHVDRNKAIEALDKAQGEPAQAIIDLTGQ